MQFFLFNKEKMGYKACSLLCFTVLLAFSSATHGLDITTMLNKYPEFNKFSKYLTETKLADEINTRKTVTILALDDSAVASLAGKSQDTIKSILSTHVLVDYFDEQRLMAAEGSHAKVTTLFQSSGVANGDQGFIYVGLINEGEIAFQSAVKDAPYNAKLVRTVVTEPFTVSILQITEPITVPGIDGSAASIAGSPEASVTEESVSGAPGSAVEGPEGALSGSGSRTQMGFVGVVMALASSIFFFSL